MSRALQAPVSPGDTEDNLSVDPQHVVSQHSETQLEPPASAPNIAIVSKQLAVRSSPLCVAQPGSVAEFVSTAVRHDVQDAFEAHSGLRAPVARITISEEWSAWQPPATDDRPETGRQKCPVQACEEQRLELFEQWLPSNLKQNAFKTAPRAVLSMRRVLNMVRIEFVDCSGRDIDEKVWCNAIALGLHRNQLINPLFGLPVLDPKHSWSRYMLVALKHFGLLRKIQSSGNADARRPRQETDSVRLERLPDRASIKVALLQTMRDMVNHARPRRPDRWAARRRQHVHLGNDLPQRQGWTVRGVDEG